MLRLQVIASRFGLRPYTSPTPWSRISGTARRTGATC
jgi:hypothetical protein